MQSLILRMTVPVPANGLWPNDRTHWARKARLVRQSRAVAHLVAMEAARAAGWIKPVPQPTVKAIFLLPGRKRDPDNCVAALKSVLDGITDAGVWTDDRDLTILPPRVFSRVEWKAAGLRGPGLTLEISPQDYTQGLKESR